MIKNKGHRGALTQIHVKVSQDNSGGKDAPDSDLLRVHGATNRLVPSSHRERERERERERVRAGGVRDELEVADRG